MNNLKTKAYTYTSSKICFRMVFYCNQVRFLSDGMGCRQSFNQPAIVSPQCYCHWAGKTNLCTQVHLSQSKLPCPQALPHHLAEFFSTYHFSQAHPRKAHRQPWIGFLWPSEVAGRSTPAPVFFSLFPGLLDASAPHTGNHRA